MLYDLQDFLENIDLHQEIEKASPLIEAALLLDEYDYVDDENTLSATDIMKSTRQLILEQRADLDSKDVTVTSSDIREHILKPHSSEAYGATVRTVGNAWDHYLTTHVRTKLFEALKLLYPVGKIDRILDNLICQERLSKKIGKYTVTGKPDYILFGRVHDIKTLKAYKHGDKAALRHYVLQGSIYRYLNPEIITKDFIVIDKLIKDFALSQAKGWNKDYPPSMLTSHRLPLLSLEETEQYIQFKLDQYDKYRYLEEDEIPECNDIELNVGETTYAYFTNSKNKRATKVFGSDEKEEALEYLSKQSKGELFERLGKANTCLYCKGFSMCSQADKLMEQGILVPYED